MKEKSHNGRNLLVCKHLSKTYKALGTDTIVALRDVSFSLKNRDILFVCGHNGSGKTTILKIIAGNEKSDSGEILFNDGSVLRNWEAYRTNNYTWVSQTLDDSIVDYVRIDELASVLRKERIIALAKKIGANWLIQSIVRRKGYKLVSELSSGQKQLLVGLIALDEPKPILLLDEVFKSLDINIAHLYWNEVRKYIYESNGCGIIVTQDLKFAKDHATQLLVLKRGEVSFNSSPSEITMQQLAIEVSHFSTSVN